MGNPEKMIGKTLWEMIKVSHSLHFQGVQELRSSDITTDGLGVKPLHLMAKEIKGYNDRRPP